MGSIRTPLQIRLRGACGYWLSLLIATPLAAALVPAGDWPLDAVTTATQRDGQLFRACGLVLERWDLTPDPPVLLDSLRLDAPLVDLLDWDGLLLSLDRDNLLCARDPQGDWSTPLWTLETGSCQVSQLLRQGDWLLPIGLLQIQPVDLGDPLHPVQSLEGLWGVGDQFQGTRAAFLGDLLIGDYLSWCPGWWDAVSGARWHRFGPEGDQHEGGFLGWSNWPLSPLGIDIAATADAVITDDEFDLQVRRPESWETVWSQSHGHRSQMRLAVRGSDVLLSDPDTLHAYHVDLQASPPVLELGRLALPGGTELEFPGDTALVTQPAGCSWIRLADGGPQLLRELPAAGTPVELAWAGERLLLRGRGLEVLQVTEDGLRREGRLELPAGSQLVAAGTLALADVPGGLAVIDLGDPAAPVVAATVPAVNPRRLVLVPGLAVYQEGGELVLLDLAQPAAPQVRERLELPVITRLAAAEGWLAVGAGENSILLLQLSATGFGTAHWLTDPGSQFAFVGGHLVTTVLEGDLANLHLHVYSPAEAGPPVLLQNLNLGAGRNFQLEGGRERLGLKWSSGVSGGIAVLDLFDLREDSGLVRTGRLVLEGREIGRVRLSGAAASADLVCLHESGRGLQVVRDEGLAEVDAPLRPATTVLAAWPNPFNPVTQLEFNLEQAGPARLAVFDLLGREVAVLLDGPQPAGIRRLNFEAAGLPSGLYLARLETAGASHSLKLALVR
ncbi:MAG: T9SS type A sorting domain-containing protein [Candidatus Delongbacteria bacterium]